MKNKILTMVLLFSCLINNAQGEQKSSQSDSRARNYFVGVTPKESEDIQYIIVTMGKATNLLQLLPSKSKLEGAGDRVMKVHPLQYLKVVFTNEEMKVSMRNIRKSNSLWNNFINGFGSRKGIKNSFDEEYGLGNVTDSQFKDFVAAVQVNASLIQSSYRNRQWEEFIDLLIKHVPRKGNPKKYDM